ncbi:flagellar assembly peptidoglycan hydrolase FlgJ, partial [Bordetella bronchiseptica]
AAAARALAGTAAPAPLVRDLRGNYVQPDPAPRREVNALLDVLRSNRARDRAMAAAEGAPSHVVDFVSRMSRAANVAAQQSGVPARLILGQAALESGWGRRELRHEDGSTSYNLFGIKAGASWKGKVVNVMTTEYVDGVAQKLVQPFRAYSSYEESFSDYARLIGNSPRYEAVTQAGNEIEAARRIQEAGYATDPRYAEKLISIMGQLRTSVARADFSGGL